MSKLLLSIDQSINKSGCILWKDGVPIEWFVLRTSTDPKCNKKDAQIFETKRQAAKFIAKELAAFAFEADADVVYEHRALMARGNQVENLATLMAFMKDEFDRWEVNHQGLTPLTIKKFARQYLPDPNETTREVKKVRGKIKTCNVKVKMKDAKMIEAIKHSFPGDIHMFEGLTYNGKVDGLGDLADSYWIAKKFLAGNK